MIRLVLFVCLMGCALATNHLTCPDVHGKTPIDLTSMAGVWYLWAGTPFLSSVAIKCGEINIEHMKDLNEMQQSLIKFNYTGRAKDAEFHATMTGTPMVDDHTGTYFGVWEMFGKILGVYNQYVISTDYDNYVVFYICKQNFDKKTSTFSKNHFASIWGRKREANKETLSILMNQLSSYDIEGSEMLLGDQATCK